MAKTARKKPFKVSPASKRRSRADVVRQIAEGTDLKPGKVREVFDVLGSLIAADLGRKGQDAVRRRFTARVMAEETVGVLSRYVAATPVPSAVASVS